MLVGFDCVTRNVATILQSEASSQRGEAGLSSAKGYGGSYGGGYGSQAGKDKALKAEKKKNQDALKQINELKAALRKALNGGQVRKQVLLVLRTC